jgi:hypothetical protein
MQTRDCPQQSEPSGAGPGRGWRPAILAVTAAMGAVLVTACGASSPGGSSGAAGTTAYQKAVAFARCMRSHGAPSWPDPNSQGVFTVTPATNARFAAPASAEKTCRHLLPDGGQKPPQQATPQQMRRMLKFTACMRAHGVPAFPDPNAGGGFSLGGTSINAGSAGFQAAGHLCQKIAPW